MIIQVLVKLGIAVSSDDTGWNCLRCMLGGDYVVRYIENTIDAFGPLSYGRLLVAGDAWSRVFDSLRYSSLRQQKIVTEPTFEGYGA
jgi:hypothetical protein